MKKLLIVIDVQNDFINNNTEFLIKKISDMIEDNIFDDTVFTRFINSYESVFFKKLKYKGCISDEGKKIALNTFDNIVIDKTGYTVLVDECIKYINNNNIDEIYLCGIDTECCILKSALDMFEQGFNVFVLKDYCASTYGKKRHDNAIEILKRNIGEKYII